MTAGGRRAGALALGLLLLLGAGAAAEPGSPGAFPGAWRRAGRILREGRTDLYLSGYAYHGRGTYSRAKLDDLNERAWGIGAGRSLARGPRWGEGLYVIASRDSHGEIQAAAGYVRTWRWTSCPWVTPGLGFTPFLWSRADVLGRLPFPAVLPVGTLELGRAALVISYLPPVHGRADFADVLGVLVRLSLR